MSIFPKISNYSSKDVKSIVFCLTIDASIGKKRVVVAVLLEHSVNMATSRHNKMEMAKGGMLCSGMRLSPSHTESPDFFKI